MDNLFFLEVKCKATSNHFYARFDFAADDIWCLTYGVKSLPGGSGSSGGSTSRDLSSVRVGPQYKCPWCGNKSFVHCGKCGSYTCYDESGYFSCGVCDNSGKVGGTITNVDANASGRGQ